MSIPTYDRCMEPLLEVLSEHPNGLAKRQAVELTADRLGIGPEARLEMLASGRDPVYSNRIGWAYDRLKRAGLASSPRRGIWGITERGLAALAAWPRPWTDDKVRELARGYLDVRLRSPAGDSVPTHVASPQAIAPADGESSPDERLDLAVDEIRSTVVRELIDLLGRVAPDRFESIVLDLLHRMGYGASRSDLTRVGGSGDGGIDGVISLDRLGLEKVYVQAKRWQGTVGRPEIQAFFGALAGQKARKGVFITTSSYSSQALEFARSVEGIVLVDGERLANLMIDHEVGVGSRLVRVPRIDGDYFEDFVG
jgi:restriction system protein